MSLSFRRPEFAEVSSLEWLVTNGLGGFAAGTVSGAFTRRYHGLLFAALDPPARRQLYVSKIEESLSADGQRWFEWSANQYPGTVFPEGFRYLTGFQRLPLPKASYRREPFLWSKTVWMVHGANTVIVEYANEGKMPFFLKLQPLFADRDYHSLQQFRADWKWPYELLENGLRLQTPGSDRSLHWLFPKGEFAEDRQWYYRFEYAKERYRGLDFREDTYCLGHVTQRLAPGERIYQIFSIEDEPLPAHPVELKKQELKRIQGLAPAYTGHSWARDLAVVADQFVVQRASTGKATLLAGYPWFTDWGRDTMIALRGLCLCLEKFDTARSILETFLGYVDRGMLPNRFPDQGEKPEYNTIDATLWLFVALYEHFRRSGDPALIQEAFPKLVEILEAHFRGTRYDIKVTAEGLLSGGSSLDQLTWMDVRVGDEVVTPRHGCPVEINALWYNALRIFEWICETLPVPQTKTLDACRRYRLTFEQHFRLRFWREEEGYLNDVAPLEGAVDARIRPNQLYALSLPFPLLNPLDGARLLAVVERQLLTEYGLRTLSPDDPDFEGQYGGDAWTRDVAYHQGTVWVFLLSEYWKAYRYVHGDTPEFRQRLLRSLRKLRSHFYEADALCAVSEIFDGGEPGPGRGAVQQAWSVGALLECLEMVGWKDPA